MPNSWARIHQLAHVTEAPSCASQCSRPKPPPGQPPGWAPGVDTTLPLAPQKTLGGRKSETRLTGDGRGLGAGPAGGTSGLKLVRQRPTEWAGPQGSVATRPRSATHQASLGAERCSLSGAPPRAGEAPRTTTMGGMVAHMQEKRLHFGPELEWWAAAIRRWIGEPRAVASIRLSCDCCAGLNV
jgi:hypothetical protein